MNDIAIRFDHVGKLYKLGLVGTGTLSHDLNRWWKTTILRQEDPYLKIGETNNRSKKGASEYVWALKDITFDVHQGDVVGIIGKNGAGKTTLLRKMAGELLRRTDIHAAYMPQNYEELLELDQTPVEYLASSGDKEELTRIRTYLGSLKYTADEMEHSVRELSGGQKAKVLLLKMSLSGADVLILDEPTRNFSPLSNPVIREVLKGFGGAVLSISHDRKYIAEVCDTVYELRKEGLCKIR